MSTILRRISGVFGGTNEDKKKAKKLPPQEPMTHRQRMKLRAHPDDDENDITAQFALVFETLDKTASGTDAVREICHSLRDESEKLKETLAPKKAHE